MFELHIADNDVTTGTIPIAWCLDAESVKTLRGFDNPKVVIVVAPATGYHSKKELRYVADVSDGMAYVSFKYPGANRIMACIMEDRSGKLKNAVLERGWDHYSNALLDYDGENFSRGLDFAGVRMPFVVDKPLEVEVPESCFAAEPSEAEAAWVTWLLNWKSADQCSFRRKRIFAYTLQPFIFVGNLLVKLFGLILALVFGLRSLNFSGFRHPLDTDIASYWKSLFAQGPIFILPEPKKWKDHDPDTFREGVEYLVVRGGLMLVSPPFLAMWYVLQREHAWKGFFLVVGVAAIVITVIVILASGALAGVFRAFDAWLNKLLGPTKEEIEQQLVCTGTPQLPKRRTVKLRYQELKSQVCKPFAG